MIIKGTKCTEEWGEKMKDKIKKLTELVGQLSKLVLKIVELLSYMTLAEMAIKTIIQIWFNL